MSLKNTAHDGSIKGGQSQHNKIYEHFDAEWRETFTIKLFPMIDQ